MADDDDRRPEFLPVIVMVGLVLLMILGWWLFPKLAAIVAHEDCIGTGRTNCA